MITNRCNNRLALVILLFFSFVSHAAAETTVPALIGSDTTWNSAGSPYIISSPVEIAVGATLTIQPGVVIKFDDTNDDPILDVYGTIDATGTAEDPVVFTSFKDDTAGGDTNGDGTESEPASGDWSAFTFQPGSSGTLEYTSVRYGSIRGDSASLTLSHDSFYINGIFAGNSTLKIEDSTFDRASTGVDVGSGSIVDIKRSVITHARRFGISVSGGEVTVSDTTVSETGPSTSSSAMQLTAGATASVTHSTFDGGVTGINVMAKNTLTLSDSVVKNFSSNGIYDTIGPVILGFAQNSLASPYDGADITVSHSEITGNGTGVVLRDSSTTAVHGNSIHGNTTGADGLDFENNWWGDASGPHDPINNPDGLGDEVTDAVDYTPWLPADPLLEEEVTCCSSVVFLPGIQGSRLYSASQGGEQLWEPFNNAEVKKLYLNAQGKSVDQTIYTKEAIDTFKAFGIAGPSIYGSFMDTMDGLVDEGAIADWKALPYDWRQAVTDIAANGVKLQSGISDMADEIQSLAANSKTGKVTIIAHSNGGLAAKALMIKLQQEGNAGLVDKVIFVAVPQLGTPDAIKVLLHGMELGPSGIIMDRETARNFAENMPGAYGLLPSEQYFQTVTDPVVTFGEGVDDVANFTGKYGPTITTAQELSDFLLGKEGRKKPASINVNAPNILNSALLTQAQSTHQALDGWQPPEGVELVQVAGWGVDTIKGIKYVAKYPCTKLITNTDLCKPYLDEEPIMTKEGDRTVVYPSATSSEFSRKYYLDIESYNDREDANIDHKYIMEASSLLNFVESLIKDTEPQEPFISQTKPNQNIESKSIHISIHSPASIDLYDAEGSHTGLVPTTSPDVTQYEENIPNSFYMEFGEGKYAGFDAESSNTINVQGTGAGTFTLVVERREGDSTVKTETFADIPITPDTKAQVAVPENATASLALDIDGNGSKDFTIQPAGSEGEIDPVLFLQILKQTVISLKLPSKVEQQVLQKIDKAIKLITKDKKKKVVALIRQFARNVEDKKWKKIKKFTPEQRDALVVMIGNLLDTIK